MFKVLPFGLQSGPLVCKKLFTPLIKKWRTENIKIVLFFDDGCLAASSFDLCKQQAQNVKCDLLRAHILPNCEKSNWLPKKSAEWLGYYWNFKDKNVSISPIRIGKLFSRLFQFRRLYPVLSPRIVAGIVGSIVSMKTVLGDKSLFLTRFLQSLINYRNFF